MTSIDGMPDGLGSDQARTRWRVWCKVPGRNGPREAWLMKENEVAEFADRQDAEAEVKRLTELLKRDWECRGYSAEIVEVNP